MDFVTREDWSGSGRLNEEMLAERLAKDELLTVFQRYRIACVYCLRVDSRDCVFAALWKLLTPEEKASLCGEDDPNHSSEKNRLVLLWSYYLDRGRDEKVTGLKKYLWRYAIEQAVVNGNRAALMPCWRFLNKNLHQYMAMKMAFSAFRLWLCTQPDKDSYTHLATEWRKNLVSGESSYHGFYNVQEFNLPFYYSDLLCFFLSEMNEANQLAFFKKAFQDKRANYILECFLDWPHQDNFLPKIRKLWGILPHYNYGRCLLILVCKYSEGYDWEIPRTDSTKEDRYYDYQSLLFQLWEETPEDYKRYLFKDTPSSCLQWKKLNEGRKFLPRLLRRYPFQEADERFFKRVINELTEDEKKALIYSEKSGELMCSILTQRQNWPLINWLLEKCLPENEIVNFKKQFIQSVWRRNLCVLKLQFNEEPWLENATNWSFELDEERKDFKEKLIYGYLCLDACQLFACEDQFSELERMIDIYLDFDEMKEKFKAYLAHCSSISLLRNLAFKKLDRILAWCFDLEEKLVKFKKEIVFCDQIVEIHYNFVFEKQWENVKRFYEWFGLSAKEITALKKLTVYSDRCFRDMTQMLYGEENVLPYLPFLRWCLTDEQIINDFKKGLEVIFSIDLGHNKHAKKCLDYLIKYLLSDLRKETEKKTGSETLDEEQVLSYNLFPSEEKQTGQESYLVQTRGEKRAAHEATKEESPLPKRRMAN